MPNIDSDSKEKVSISQLWCVSWHCHLHHRIVYIDYTLPEQKTFFDLQHYNRMLDVIIIRSRGTPQKREMKRIEDRSLKRSEPFLWQRSTIEDRTTEKQKDRRSKCENPEKIEVRRSMIDQIFCRPFSATSGPMQATCFSEFLRWNVIFLLYIQFYASYDHFF